MPSLLHAHINSKHFFLVGQSKSNFFYWKDKRWQLHIHSLNKTSKSFFKLLYSLQKQIERCLCVMRRRQISFATNREIRRLIIASSVFGKQRAKKSENAIDWSICTKKKFQMIIMEKQHRWLIFKLMPLKKGIQSIQNSKWHTHRHTCMHACRKCKSQFLLFHILLTFDK